MGLLRKHKNKVTRKASRFTNRPVVSLRAYRAAFRGPVNDSRYHRRHRLRLMPFFHDSTRLVDSFTHLTGLTPAEIDERYDSLPDVIAEGQADRRFYNPILSGGESYSFSTPRVVSPLSSPARVPARIRSTKYLVAPPSPVVSPAGVHNEYLQFNSPRQVLTCVRRRQRREVLFALRRAGGGHKKPRWREDSYIRC